MKQLIYQILLKIETSLPFELVWRCEKDLCYIHFKGRFTGKTYLTFTQDVDDLPDPPLRLRTALELEEMRLRINPEPFLDRTEVDAETIRKNRERIDWMIIGREQERELQTRIENSRGQLVQEETIKLAA